GLPAGIRIVLSAPLLRVDGRPSSPPQNYDLSLRISLLASGQPLRPPLDHHRPSRARAVAASPSTRCERRSSPSMSSFVRLRGCGTRGAPGLPASERPAAALRRAPPCADCPRP